MNTDLLIEYTNGNANIKLYKDGTRIIEYPDHEPLSLDQPLNIDIKVTNQCDFGMNPKTGNAFCNFCHESARTDGKECDYEELKSKLIGLNAGIELAIGANKITHGLEDFLKWCYHQGFICNLTVNMGHWKAYSMQLNMLKLNGYIKGLGVSYRSKLKEMDHLPIIRDHVVFHVIVGIDTIQEVMALTKRGVGKILILGEKDFGFNQGNVNLDSHIHRDWQMYIHQLFDKFAVVSFDNLALNQLQLKRLFNDQEWNQFYQGERSFYIDAVGQTFAPSSRSGDKLDWDGVTIKDYFRVLNK